MQIRNRKGEVLCEVLAVALKDADLRGVALYRANLSRADLSWADLRGVDLSGADLSEALLCRADLRGADMTEADLSEASLRMADLRGADLSGADLHGADLTEADLRGADLTEADLRLANLRGAVLPLAITPSKGRFTGYKKVLQADGTYAVIELLIPPDARRTSALSSRKCRASHVVVVKGAGISPTCDKTLTYTPGITVEADSYNPDRREECVHGIHFFMTREEAEAYQP